MKTIHPITRIFGIFVALFLMTNGMHAVAQTTPAIFSIFKKYENHYGVNTFEASDELLKAHKITTFKSLIFEKTKVPLLEIKNCIEKDKVNASTIKENKQNGLIYSGYYKLLGKNGNYRYIIFKATADASKGTLIFIEGKITPNELVELLQ